MKDKPAKTEHTTEAQQYIEVCVCVCVGWGVGGGGGELSVPFIHSLFHHQVWNGDVLLKTIDVKVLKKHGKIHEDGRHSLVCCLYKL